jgi:hypothetical protein
MYPLECPGTVGMYRYFPWPVCFISFLPIIGLILLHVPVHPYIQGLLRKTARDPKYLFMVKVLVGDVCCGILYFICKGVYKKKLFK